MLIEQMAGWQATPEVDRQSDMGCTLDMSGARPVVVQEAYVQQLMSQLSGEVMMTKRARHLSPVNFHSKSVVCYPCLPYTFMRPAFLLSANLHLFTKSIDIKSRNYRNPNIHLFFEIIMLEKCEYEQN